MTLSAPNNPVEARGKASKRAVSGRMAVRHRARRRPGKAVVRSWNSDRPDLPPMSGRKRTVAMQHRRRTIFSWQPLARDAELPHFG